MLDTLTGVFLLAFQAVVLGGLFVVGLWSLFHAVRQTVYWPRASAEVVRYWITRSEGKPNGQRFYHPVLRFQTADGQMVTTISSSGWWRRSWPIGQMLPIRYDPRRAQWAEIALLTNVWSMPAFFLGFPMAWVLAGIWLPRLLGR